MTDVDRTERFESNRSAIADVRSVLRRTVPGVSMDSILVASELATHVVRASTGGFSMSIAVDDRLRLELRDDDSVQDAESEIRSERPLTERVLDVLTTRWGVDRDDGGAILWAEMERS